jgi:hypothetical protein
MPTQYLQRFHQHRVLDTSRIEAIDEIPYPPVDFVVFPSHLARKFPVNHAVASAAETAHSAADSRRSSALELPPDIGCHELALLRNIALLDTRFIQNELSKL